MRAKRIHPPGTFASMGSSLTASGNRLGAKAFLNPHPQVEDKEIPPKHIKRTRWPYYWFDNMSNAHQVLREPAKLVLARFTPWWVVIPVALIVVGMAFSFHY